MANRLRRPRNWRGETRRQESERRIAALEASVQETHERLNEAFNRIGALEKKTRFTAGGI